MVHSETMDLFLSTSGPILDWDESHDPVDKGDASDCSRTIRMATTFTSLRLLISL